MAEILYEKCAYAEIAENIVYFIWKTSHLEPIAFEANIQWYIIIIIRQIRISN